LWYQQGMRDQTLETYAFSYLRDAIMCQGQPIQLTYPYGGQGEGSPQMFEACVELNKKLRFEMDFNPEALEVTFNPTSLFPLWNKRCDAEG
jgi:hypothetical protein